MVEHCISNVNLSFQAEHCLAESRLLIELKGSGQHWTYVPLETVKFSSIPGQHFWSGPMLLLNQKSNAGIAHPGNYGSILHLIVALIPVEKVAYDCI
jgi:hypothetical protein